MTFTITFHFVQIEITLEWFLLSKESFIIQFPANSKVKCGSFKNSFYFAYEFKIWNSEFNQKYYCNQSQKVCQFFFRVCVCPENFAQTQATTENSVHQTMHIWNDFCWRIERQHVCWVYMLKYFLSTLFEWRTRATHHHNDFVIRCYCCFSFESFVFSLTSLYQMVYWNALDCVKWPECYKNQKVSRCQKSTTDTKMQIPIEQCLEHVCVC